MNPAISTTTIHPKRSSDQLLEPLVPQVLTAFHSPHDLGEGDELLLLAAQ